jgi:hypothetical protein
MADLAGDAPTFWRQTFKCTRSGQNGVAQFLSLMGAALIGSHWWERGKVKNRLRLLHLLQSEQFRQISGRAMFL